MVKHMGKKLEKITAIIIVSIILTSFVGCKRQKEAENPLSYEQITFKRADVNLSEMTYVRFDERDILSAIEKMTALAEESTQTGIATKEQKEAYKEAFETMNTQYDRFVSAYYLAMIDSYLDLTDLSASAEIALIDEMSVDIADKLTVAIGRTIDSPLKATLVALHKSDNILVYEGNTESDEELNRLLLQEAALEHQYDEMSVKDYASYEEMNKELGNVIIELVGVRNKIAQRCGYENYVDYAFNEVYYRDYSIEDYKRVTQYIKKYLLKTENDLDREVYFNYNPYESDGIDLTDALYELSASDDLSKMMSDALRYMYTRELYIFTDSENSLNEAFSAKFYDVNEPFIYISLTHSAYDISNLLHESGHFISYFVGRDNALSESFCSLEVAETQSLGFHLLFCDTLEDIYPEYDNMFEINALSDALYSLVWVSWRTDLEHELYMTDGLTLKKANEIAGKLSEEYELGIADKNGEVLYWAGIPHIATSPIYQVSYVMSALSAMGLWQESLSDEHDAEEKLEGIMLLDSTSTYKKMLETFELEYVLDEKFFENLCGLIDKRFLR